MKNNTTVTGGSIKRMLPKCEKAVEQKDCRGKEARFCNRKRPEGWLTPTAEQLKRTILNQIHVLEKFLPVTDICIEMNRFDFARMDNPDIRKWQYQKGRLHGYEDKEDLVSEQQNGKCLLCGKPIEHFHHLVPQHRNGSDTIDNIAGLCNECHDKVHTDPETKKELASRKEGINKKYGALSVLNQVMPSFLEELTAAYPGHVHVVDAYQNMEVRKDFGIPKDHCYDAYCTILQVTGTAQDPAGMPVHEMKQFRRHDRQALHKANDKRMYYLDGKLVGTNRHRATEQEAPALDEAGLTKEEISRLEVRHVPRQYRQKHEYPPGSKFKVGKKTYVLQRYDGTEKTQNGDRIPNYLVDTNKQKHRYRKCQFLCHNTGIVFVS